MIGKGLSNTQVRKPSGVYAQGGECVRGARMDPPKGAKQPGRKLSNSQTRNSPSNKA